MSAPPPVVPGLVSIVLPVHNRAALLREAIASALSQTYRPIEILLVDDGSTDDTVETCRALARDHADSVRLLRQPQAGPGAAREAGRVEARGEFLQYLDSDDLLAPDKLERQVRALRAAPDAAVAYGPTREYPIGEAGSAATAFRTGERLERLFPDLLSGRLWQTVTPLVRRDASDRAGAWLPVGQEEDWEYDARLGSLGVRLAWCPGFQADHRHHGGVRAGAGAPLDPVRLRWRVLVHERIHEHAVAAGVAPPDPHMAHFARRVFLLARQCGAAGLTTDSAKLFRLARAASTAERRRGVDFLVYGSLARALGWGTAGRLAAWADSRRGHGRLSRPGPAR